MLTRIVSAYPGRGCPMPKRNDGKCCRGAGPATRLASASFLAGQPDMVSAITVTYIYSYRNLQIFQEISKFFRVGPRGARGRVLPLIGPQEKAMRSSARKARPLLNAPLQFRATDLVE